MSIFLKVTINEKTGFTNFSYEQKVNIWSVKVMDVIDDC